jgi:S-adenosylmethionine/arginine decarboxylase-like enzyme
MLDVHGCDQALIQDAESIRRFARQLVHLIGMQPYGEPRVETFGEPATDAYGITVVQLLQTSSLVAHFSERTQAAYVDLFSCRAFDPTAVEKFVSRYFSAKWCTTRFSERGGSADAVVLAVTEPDAHARSLIGAGWEELYPEGYLREYYTTVTPDERLALEYLVQLLQRKGVPGQGSVVDFGCGPTVHRAIAVSPFANRITMADLLPANLAAIGAWLEKTRAAHSWDDYTAHILSIEGTATPTFDQINTREELTRKRIHSVSLCDALTDPPMSGSVQRKFDLVIAGFCLEVAATDVASYRQALLNVLSLVSPGGIAVVMSLCGSSAYRVGSYYHVCYPVEIRDVMDGFSLAGLTDIDIQTQAVPELSPLGYSQVLLASASRPLDHAGVAAHARDVQGSNVK